MFFFGHTTNFEDQIVPIERDSMLFRDVDCIWLHHLWNTPFFATVRLTARPVPRWCSRHKTAFFAPFRTGWDRNHHGIWKDIHVAIPWDVYGILVGGLEHFFPYIGNNNPDWRTHIFQRGGSTTKQDLMVIFMGCAWFLWDCIESDRDIMGFICDFIIIWISAGISGKLCNHKQCGIHPMPCTTWGKIDICWFSPTRWLARCCEMVLHQICFLLG